MTPSSYDIPLHDIKPLMEVPDSSGTLLMLMLLIAVVLGAGTLYLLYRRLRFRQKVNIRKQHYEMLSHVDFSDAKRAAYLITEHGRLFSKDSERLFEAYQNLVERLEPYKYRKTVSPIDNESRSYYKIYLEMIDV
jgi:uncharacterized protein HemX